jgi:hypothetical protein
MTRSDLADYIVGGTALFGVPIAFILAVIAAIVLN